MGVVERERNHYLGSHLGVAGFIEKRLNKEGFTGHRGGKKIRGTSVMKIRTV